MTELHLLDYLVLTLAPLAIAWSFVMMVRNHYVYQHKQRLLHEVSRLAKQDIEGGFDFLWRYDGLAQGQYEQMVHQFWRPLMAFYPDQSFLNPEIKRTKNPFGEAK